VGGGGERGLRTHKAGENESISGGISEGGTAKKQKGWGGGRLLEGACINQGGGKTNRWHFRVFHLAVVSFAGRGRKKKKRRASRVPIERERPSISVKSWGKKKV